MTDRKKLADKEKILSYLLRKGSLCNTYKVARESGMKRWDVLESLQELAKEGKVRLMHGSVKAVTEELEKVDNLKTKSEVDELKERVEKLEKVITFTFDQIAESVQMGYQKLSSKKQLSDNEKQLNQDDMVNLDNE